MKKQTLLIWNIIVLFCFILLTVNGFRLYRAYKEYSELGRKSKKVVIGTDKELEKIIDYLENRLKDREQFTFALNTEPLNLTNVVFLSDDIAEVVKMQMMNKIRVSCIVEGSKPSAVVQYQGKNYQLSTGDKIAGGVVKSITTKEMILFKDGKEIHYPIQGLTITQERAQELLQGNDNRREEG